MTNNQPSQGNEEIARNALRGDTWPPSKEVKEALIYSVIKALDQKDTLILASQEEVERLKTNIQFHINDKTDQQAEIARLKEENERLHFSVTVCKAALNMVLKDSRIGDGWIDIRTLDACEDALTAIEGKGKK